MPSKWTRIATVMVAVGSLLAVDGAAEAGAFASSGTPARSAALGTAAAVKPTPVSEAADVVSARLAARAQGSRVEVTSLQDETSTTWVNPDGTLTTEAHGGPIRFRDRSDPQGAWRDVDLTMAPVPDGTVAPKGHPLGLSLAGDSKAAGGAQKGTGRTDLAVAKQGKGKRGQNRGVTFGWEGSLGAPVLSGATATYREVKPGVDLVVDVRRTGYETHLVVKSRGALNGLRKASTDVVSWQIPVQTDGLTARAEKDGSVSFVDADGQVTSFVPAPVAWDDKIDPHSGNRASESPVAMTIVQQGPGRAVLALTPDQDWLFSPDRVFPVTIDPTYASGKMTTISDAYVSSAYPTSNYRSSTELRVGTYNGGGDKQRSFLQFDFSGYKNLDIVSASLSLYETWSYSCTATPFYVYASGATDGSVTWNTQPGVGSQHGALTTAKGYSSSCAAGRVSVPITSLMSYWSGNAYSTGWLRLSASESDSYGWKKFSSLQTTDDPYITFTYNRKPNAAATPDLGGTADGANSFTLPGTSTTQLFTKDSTPRFYSSATDPDASQVAVTFEVHSTTSSPSSATLVSSCTTGLGASGARVYCSPTTALAENTTYYVRAAVKDDRGLWNGTWSPWRTFYTLWSAPPAPKVRCDRGYTTGMWTDADPAGTVTCSITAAGVAGTYKAPGYLDVVVDGVAQARLAVTPTNDWTVVHKTVTFAPTARGYHEIKVTGISRSLTVSPQAVYGFGWGAASLTSPAAGTASSGTVRVTAGGPPKGTATTVTAKTRWRVAGAGNETTGWTDAASGPVTVTPSGTAAAAYTGVFDLTSAVREAGATADLPTRTPVRLDVQVCFTYTGASTSTQCTWSQSRVTVTRLPHAFGAGYPTADTGLGQVALFTGEVALDATDVSVPGYSGDITLSRSHVSFAGDQTVTGWPADAVTGVFGPGWTASLEGGQAGLAGLQVVDNTGVDGSIAFVDGEGEPLVYANPADTRSYPTGGSVVYGAATQDTDAAAVKLTVTGTGTATRLTLTEDDGTATTWAPLATPSTAGTTWRPDTISEPGQSGKTTFGTDGTGRITRIVAAVPDGMSGTACPTSGALARGCRAIDITYATSTTATATTPGDVAGQVKAVSAWLWNPAASAMAQTTVATYAYDSSGRLVQVRDPRTTLGTDYTWDDASTRIASVRASGLAETKLSYNSGKLTQVSREAPISGQPDVTTARYVYGVATSGAGLPTLTAGAVAAWYQQQAPAIGYAVFGQDYTGPVSGTGVDWSYADLFYVDAFGSTVNTASYGAGAWQVTAADFDTSTTGNVTRQLTATATA